MPVNTAVVLAAGEGKRLRPLTTNRPKPMLPAANRPVLEYVLDALVDAGIEDIHIVVGYRHERIQSHFGPTYRDRPLTYHTQDKQLGSGHALLAARDAIEGDVLVVNGDEVITPGIVDDVIDGHGAGDVCTLAVSEEQDATRFGAVRLDGETVVELVERPSEGTYRLFNVGVYAFDPSFLPVLEETHGDAGELALTDGIAAVTERGDHVRGVRVDGLYSKVAYPWDLPALTVSLLARGRIDERETEPGVYVADSATVADDATLYAPVVVGEDALIEPGAVVGPDTAIGRNVTVESSAVVRRSVLDVGTRVGANATLVDSVAGEAVSVGVGAAVAGGMTEIRVGDRIHDERLGGVFADRAELGGGATVTPGVLVGPGAVVDPGVTLRRNVPEGAEVRG